MQMRMVPSQHDWTWGAESPPTHIMLCSNWLGKTKQANSNVNNEIKLHKIEDKWKKKQAFHFQAFFSSMEAGFHRDNIELPS